jgi:ubiquinone/menaquinone biosynthesis C-methylase UbiE
VLDLACGAGSRTAMVARQIGRDRLIAIDYSIAMLDACAAAVPGVLYVRGDAAALPIADGALAAINCSDALQALAEPGRTLREVSRCLQPGGRFTCFTFRESEFPYAYFQHGFPVDPRHVFSRRQIEALLEQADLALIDMREPRSAVFFTAEKR